MSKNTKIEWADHSWSPWRGCTKVSPGCANCYAEKLSKRNPAVLGEWGKGKPRVFAKNWGDPVRWNKRGPVCCDCGRWSRDESGDCECGQFGAIGKVRRQRVFPSLCDWLDEEVSPSWLAEFMALINLTPHLNWLLLTKRPQNWREMIDAAALASTPFHQRWLVEWLKGNPPPNVWFGVSVEDQKRADERIPLLLEIPAKVRWLSLEPLLGPVELNDATSNPFGFFEDGIHWLVIGGESGHGARPCNVSWVRSLLKQGKEASVPVFVKQLGANPCCTVTKGECIPDDLRAFSHPKAGDPLEWPTDLRVREFPEVHP